MIGLLLYSDVMVYRMPHKQILISTARYDLFRGHGSVRSKYRASHLAGVPSRSGRHEHSSLSRQSCI